MKLSLRTLAAAAALITASVGAHAVNVTVGGCNGGTSGLTTCDLGATVIDFDSGAMPANFLNVGGSGGHIVQGSSSGLYGAPLNDTTPYLAVPSATSVGSVEAYLGGSYNYFGIYWGSIDAYNSLTFMNNGVQVAVVTGADIIANSALEGSQVQAGANEYVNFYFGAQAFTNVIDTSTNYAFESDNWAFGNNVPAPTSLGLMGLGLLAVGFGVRRRTALNSVAILA